MLLLISLILKYTKLMYTTGTIIALAWPDTKVIREGKWYDIPLIWLGIIKNEYLIAGHAAFLLINNTNGEVQYFDYGRYHTPLMHGRVRDFITDPDITIHHKAAIKNGKITNLDQLLLDRYHLEACHGDGRLTASIVKNIHHDKAYAYVKKMQEREAIPYGPFELKGSTCSRLVAQVVLASTNNWLTKLLIRVPYTVSATPRSNNKVLNDCSHYYEIIDGEIYKKKSKFYRVKSLLSSTKHTHEKELVDFSSAQLSVNSYTS